MRFTDWTRRCFRRVTPPDAGESWATPRGGRTTFTRGRSTSSSFTSSGFFRSQISAGAPRGARRSSRRSSRQQALLRRWEKRTARRARQRLVRRRRRVRRQVAAARRRQLRTMPRRRRPRPLWCSQLLVRWVEPSCCSSSPPPLRCSRRGNVLPSVEARGGGERCRGADARHRR